MIRSRSPLEVGISWGNPSRTWVCGGRTSLVEVVVCRDRPCVVSERCTCALYVDCKDASERVGEDSSAERSRGDRGFYSSILRT